MLTDMPSIKASFSNGANEKLILEKKLQTNTQLLNREF